MAIFGCILFQGKKIMNFIDEKDPQLEKAAIVLVDFIKQMQNVTTNYNFVGSTLTLIKINEAMAALKELSQTLFDATIDRE